MGRPRMDVREWGKITLTAQVRGNDGTHRTAPPGADARTVDRWRARAKVRDDDGRVREVERYARTKAAAERVLKDALRERVTPAPQNADLKPGTLVKDAAAVWLAGLAHGDLSLNSRRVYESAMNKHVIGTDAAPGPLAHLSLREVRVSALGGPCGLWRRTTGRLRRR